MFTSLPRPKNGDTSPTFTFTRDKINKNNQRVLIQKNRLIIDNTSQYSDSKINSTSKLHPGTISKLYLNSDGSVDYAKTIATSLTNTATQSSFSDTIPLKKKFPNLIHNFPKPPLDPLLIDEMRQLVSRLLQGDVPSDSSTIINHTSSNIFNPLTKKIQINTLQQDPLAPSQFKLKKNRHKPPSPPPPIIKSINNEKLTKQEKDYWNIPSAVSNWKNNQGFTIDLNKRVANDVDNTPEINLSGFSKLNLALDEADTKARSEIKIRNQLLKQKAIKDQEEKHAQLHKLVDITRRERSEKKRSYNDYENNDRSYNNDQHNKRSYDQNNKRSR